MAAIMPPCHLSEELVLLDGDGYEFEHGPAWRQDPLGLCWRTEPFSGEQQEGWVCHNCFKRRTRLMRMGINVDDGRPVSVQIAAWRKAGNELNVMPEVFDSSESEDNLQAQATQEHEPGGRTRGITLMDTVPSTPAPNNTDFRTVIHGALKAPTGIYFENGRPEFSQIEIIQQKVLGLKEEIDKAYETRLQLIENQHLEHMALIEQQANQELHKVQRTIEQQRTAQMEQLSLQAAQRERQIQATQLAQTSRVREEACATLMITSEKQRRLLIENARHESELKWLSSQQYETDLARKFLDDVNGPARGMLAPVLLRPWQSAHPSTQPVTPPPAPQRQVFRPPRPPGQPMPVNQPSMVRTLASPVHAVASTGMQRYPSPLRRSVTPPPARRSSPLQHRFARSMTPVSYRPPPATMQMSAAAPPTQLTVAVAAPAKDTVSTVEFPQAPPTVVSVAVEGPTAPPLQGPLEVAVAGVKTLGHSGPLTPGFGPKGKPRQHESRGSAGPVGSLAATQKLDDVVTESIHANDAGARGIGDVDVDNQAMALDQEMQEAKAQHEAHVQAQLQEAETRLRDFSERFDKFASLHATLLNGKNPS